MRIASTFALAVASLLVPVRAEGQILPTLWRPVGPEGGTVQAFAVDPSAPDTVWAVTRAGTVWVSQDAGRTWAFDRAIGGASRDGDVVNGSIVTAFAHSDSGGNAYAAVGTSIHWCCFRGIHWATKSQLTRGGEVRQLVASGVVVVARVNPAPGESGLPRLERSTDLGVTWSLAPLPGDAHPLELVADSSSAVSFDPPDRLLYARSDRGVFRSPDFGATWTSASAGITKQLAILAIAPSTPSLLYAFDTESQLYRTVNRGEQWRPRGTPVFDSKPIAPVGVIQLVVDAADASTLYLTALHQAGRRTFHTFHRSTDGGLTWHRLDQSAIVAPGLLMSVPSSPPTLLAALQDERGVLVSDDQGESFRTAKGLYGRTIQTLAASTRPTSTLYAGALPVSVATTADEGATWTERLTLGLPPLTVRVRDIDADPHDPAVAWAVDDLSALKISDFGRRIDGLTSPFGLGASRLAVASSVPATLYVVGNESCALQKSVDAGATWTCPGLAPLGTPPKARALEVDPRDADVVHLVDDTGQLFRSLDGAQSWQSLSTAFDATALAIDPLDGATIYAGTESDWIWKGVDRGSSWIPLAPESKHINPLTDLLTHPIDPDRLYATFASSSPTGVFGTRGVVATVDGGATFHRIGFQPGEVLPFTAGFPMELLSGPLAIDARLPTVLFAGTRGAGVWTTGHEVVAPCSENDRTLCLGGGRFRVQARWRDFAGRTGPGHAVRLTPDTGYFWFFEPENLELMVKALDGRQLNQRHWIFYGALSNVEFQMLVTDTETGEVNAYFNPERRFASRGDTSAFPREFQHAVRASANVAASAAPAPLAPRAGSPAPRADQDSLLLGGGRFRISVAWRDFSGREGVGRPHPLNDTTGAFWFFEPENLELAIKVLDGRALNGRFWVFYGALSNVEYRITVEDATTGEVRTYFNPSGQFASRGDTAAFPVH